MYPLNMPVFSNTITVFVYTPKTAPVPITLADKLKHTLIIG